MYLRPCALHSALTESNNRVPIRISQPHFTAIPAPARHSGFVHATTSGTAVRRQSYKAGGSKSKRPSKKFWLPGQCFLCGANLTPPFFPDRIFRGRVPLPNGFEPHPGPCGHRPGGNHTEKSANGNICRKRGGPARAAWGRGKSWPQLAGTKARAQAMPQATPRKPSVYGGFLWFPGERIHSEREWPSLQAGPHGRQKRQRPRAAGMG